MIDGVKRAGRLGQGMLSVAALALLACACSGQRDDQAASHTANGTAKGAATSGTAAIQPVVSIKELMDSTVDPAADGVWDAVGTITTASGVDHHQPRSDEEWQAVRRHAVTLAEAMNLVMLDGRHAAPTGTRPGLGEQAPAQIEAAIRANPAQFDQFATATRDVATDMVRAIDRHDVDAVMKLGGTLDDRCESCHVTYWYPNSPRPKT